MEAKMYKWSGWVAETDPAALYSDYKERLLRAGFQIMGECIYHFQPQGYTALFLLAESHFAIHTFPEESRTYLELTSCVRNQYDRFMQSRPAAEGEHVAT